MKCVLVQENWVNYSDAVYDRVGNIELSRIMGADVRLDPAGFDELASRAYAMARQAPEDPYAGLADPAGLGGTPTVLVEQHLGVLDGDQSLVGRNLADQRLGRVRQLRQRHAGLDKALSELVKVRDDVQRGDYKDPGWFKHPPGTVAYEFTGSLPDPARFKSNDLPASAFGRVTGVSPGAERRWEVSP